MEIKKFCAATGLAYIQGEWKDPPPLPYIVYRSEVTDNISADSMVAWVNPDYTIELYTEDISSEVEKRITDAANAAGLFWNKTGQAYIPDEKMWVTSYGVALLTA